MTARSLLLAATLLSGPALFATPFDTTQVAEDTKWLAHLDMDRLKSSTLGQFLIESIKSAMPKQEGSAISLNQDAVISEVHSITAYGLSFDETAQNQSVLILKTGPKAQSIIDGYLASMETQKEGQAPFKMLTGKSFPTYLIGGEVHMAFPRKDLIVISKDFAQVEKSMQVIEGRAPASAKRVPCSLRTQPRVSSSSPPPMVWITSRTFRRRRASCKRPPDSSSPWVKQATRSSRGSPSPPPTPNLPTSCAASSTA